MHFTVVLQWSLSFVRLATTKKIQSREKSCFIHLSLTSNSDKRLKFKKKKHTVKINPQPELDRPLIIGITGTGSHKTQ